MELHASTVSRRVHTAIGLGYLDNLEFRQGKEAQIVLNKPMPDDEEVLPSPEKLEVAFKK